MAPRAPDDRRRVMPRWSPSWRAWLPIVAALFCARPAAAADKVQVTITPNGQPWSVGDKGGAPCEPSCTLFLEPDKYLVIMNEVKQTLLIRVPTVLTYDAGVPKLRTIGGWTAVGAFGVGALFLGLGAYGALQTCAHSGGCPNGFDVSRPVAEGLIVTSAGLIAVGIAGAIVFAVSGDAIQVHELENAPDPPRRKSFDIMFRPAGLGGTIDFAARF